MLFIANADNQVAADVNIQSDIESLQKRVEASGFSFDYRGLGEKLG